MTSDFRNWVTTVPQLRGIATCQLPEGRDERPPPPLSLPSLPPSSSFPPPLSQGLPTQELAGDHPEKWRATNPRTGGHQPDDRPPYSSNQVFANKFSQYRHFVQVFTFLIDRRVQVRGRSRGCDDSYAEKCPSLTDADPTSHREFVSGEEGLRPILVVGGRAAVLFPCRLRAHGRSWGCDDTCAKRALPQLVLPFETKERAVLLSKSQFCCTHGGYHREQDFGHCWILIASVVPRSRATSSLHTLMCAWELHVLSATFSKNARVGVFDVPNDMSLAVSRVLWSLHKPVPSREYFKHALVVNVDRNTSHVIFLMHIAHVITLT